MARKINSTVDYMKELLQDSLLTSVPQIVQTQNIARKILKTLVLLACIIGFVYQTTEFMKIFYSYPTVMDMDVQYPNVIESPAITFCNLNGIKRSLYCSKNPQDCAALADRKKFCDKFPDICDEIDPGKIKLPIGDALYSEKYGNLEELQQFGHKSNETLKFCSMLLAGSDQLTPCSRDDELHLLIDDGNTGYKNCYTLFSNINSSKLNRHILPVLKVKQPLFHMVLKFDRKEYFRPDRQIGAIIGIHSPNTLINPFFEGFVAKPGHAYTVHLKVVEEKLLPSPYDTKCKDYKAVWESRGGKGPLNQDVCVSECIFNNSIAKAGCVERNLIYPHDAKICDEDELDTLDLNVSKCYEACPQPCEFTDFEYEIMERKMEDTSNIHSTEDFYSPDAITKDHAIVLIFLKRPEKIVYSHRPQYEDIEIFSFLGGYVGMWLGISLVAVFDFLESVVLIISYWLRRRFAETS